MQVYYLLLLPVDREYCGDQGGDICCYSRCGSIGGGVVGIFCWFCVSSSNKSLKHKVVGCFLVHFLLVSGCIGVGCVDNGVVLVVVVVVVVRVVIEVVPFFLSGNALDNSERPGVFDFILLSILSLLVVVLVVLWVILVVVGMVVIVIVVVAATGAVMVVICCQIKQTRCRWGCSTNTIIINSSIH